MRGRAAMFGGFNLLTDVQFATIGRLINGPEFAPKLRAWLRDECKYNPESGNVAEYHLLARFEYTGLIRSYESEDGEVYYKATKQGYERWCQTFDYRKQVIADWEETRNKRRSLSEFPEPNPPREKPKVPQRFPNAGELEKIVAASNPSFGRFVKFAMLAQIRYPALLTARIERINWKKGILKLEEESPVGRKNERRLLNLSQEAMEVLKEAVDGRESGLIFLNERGAPMQENAVSGLFRRIRERLGFGSEVMLAGRGGKAGQALDNSK